MIDINKKKRQARVKKHRKIRSTLSGTSSRPRVSVFRSSKNMFVQVIDDVKMETLASVSSKEIKDFKGTKVELSSVLAEKLAEKMKAKNISKIVFDRGGYKYHGRVKTLADGLRKQGIIF